MKRIGLTGNIGSGKTTVARLFSILNIPVFNSDDQAKIIMNTNDSLKESLSEVFGDKLYINGMLNRAFLSDIIFSDANAKKKLEDLVHPAVKNEFDLWCLKHSSSNYIIKEAAILFESNSHLDLDAVICVVANQETRLQRVMQRSGMSSDEVLSRMNNQWSEDKKIGLSDFVVLNGEDNLVIPQVLEIHESLK